MPKIAEPLTDTEIRKLKPKLERYRLTDAGGLLLEVMPSGAKIWRYRYTLAGKRCAPCTIGPYPEISLADARKKRDEWAALVASGKSPAESVKEEKRAQQFNTVQAFADYWLKEEVAQRSEGYKKVMRRVMEKDVFPVLGDRDMTSITPADVLALCDKIKKRGAPKMALATRDAMRRMYDFAIARQVAQFNPAAALVARFIATQESRTRVLEAREIGKVLRSIHRSDIRRSLKLALHLLVITMVRKSELIEARWDEFDFQAREWNIPAERMKKDLPHRVYLSEQAMAMLAEMRQLAGRSAFLLPTVRGGADKPIAKSTLNQAVRALDMDVQHFVLHDFRRTASTHLHEMGYPSDAIEKALAHKITGIKGVYNRAEYASQRRELLQAWADFVGAQVAEGGVVIPGNFGKAA